MTNTTLTPSPDLSGIFQPNVSRIEQLQQLFLNNYSTIREAISDAGPSLLPPDADHILEGLSERIDQFHGDLSEFVDWCVTVAQDSAHHTEKFLAIRNDPENQESVRKAIGSILAGCSGLGVDEGTLDELESDFWCKVLENLTEWLMPAYSNDGKRPPAALSTRLFGSAMWHARAWKTTQTRAKERFVEPDELDIPSHVCGRRVKCPAAD